MTSEKHNYVYGARWFGIILIFLGILGLFDQFFGIRLGHFTWPLFVLVPGVVMIVSALRAEYDSGEAFVILGSLITMTGLLLLYQSLTGHWASWAYAWALIAPTAVGLGQWLYGTVSALPGMVKSGKNLVNIGLIMFGVGFIFFELLLNISDFNLGFAGWGILLILLGALTLIRPFLSKSKGEMDRR
jgi:uncharacterized membrane protein HdeD (DUF308 family)